MTEKNFIDFLSEESEKMTLDCKDDKLLYDMDICG